MVRTCIHSHILIARFSPNLRANHWYWTNTCWCSGCTTWAHGLHCLSLYTVRLFGCNCLLEVWQWDGANLHQFPYSNCMTFFQPWCKPVVLDKQCWYLGCSTWVALAQFRTTCILAGCLVEIACLEIKLWDGANLHSFPYSNCTFFSQPSCKPLVLNKYVLMFGLHHMGTGVALSQFVYCQVVWLQLPAWSMAVRWSEPASIPIF